MKKVRLRALMKRTGLKSHHIADVMHVHAVTVRRWATKGCIPALTLEVLEHLYGR